MWKMGAWLFKWIFLVYNLSFFNIVKKRRDLFEKIFFKKNLPQMSIKNFQ